MKKSNKSRLAAVILTSLLVPASLFSCSNKTSSSSDFDFPTQSGEPVTTAKIGSIVIDADISENVNENDTVFTLNSVIDAGIVEDGKKFIFFDITIKNDTDSSYSLSTLNNFYIILPDETDLYSTVRTQIYAINTFKEDRFFVDPFEIPAKSQFSGVIGGFTVDENIESFTVCFFPTKGNPDDKEKIIKIKVDANDIKTPGADLIK